MLTPNGSVWLKSFNTNHTACDQRPAFDIATNQGGVYFGGVWNEGRNRVETDDELNVISYNGSDRDRVCGENDARRVFCETPNCATIRWTDDEGPYDMNGGSAISELVVGSWQTHGHWNTNRSIPSSDVQHHI